MDKNNIDFKRAAEDLKVSEACVRYWASFEKDPSRRNKIKIYLWSHGQVTPNDFYQLPDLMLNGNIAVLQQDLFQARASS